LNEVDCIVIGAGVIGLAVARAIARGDREVIVIEREREAGRHASSRNSEVIHAGIHYAPGSLRARLCVLGKELLYGYCDVNNIAYRRCGKLTVAASAAEQDKLEALAANARACGVELEWLDGDEARRLEPELRCALALNSPSTGIIDSHGLLQCLLGDAESYGANVAFGTRVTALRPVKAGIEVCVDSQHDAAVRARWIVNCAGLSAAAVAASIAGFPRSAIPKIHCAKGSYFSLPGRAPFSHLIYPLPATSGHLGVHLTLDLAGGARFGPDLQWLESLDDAQPDYGVDAQRAHSFIDAVRAYWPAVPAERLAPAYAGIRPKLSGPAEPARDFLISGPAEHGIPGIVNLFGIESPGLTACLALGDVVAAMIDD
jgi:L-2-hydroxyglutarate oxidase LhgO